MYPAPTVNAARAALDNLIEVWGRKYGAIIHIWESVLEKFALFPSYDPMIHQVLCSTNANESLYIVSIQSLDVPADRDRPSPKGDSAGASSKPSHHLPTPLAERRILVRKRGGKHR
ncbi:transposase [Cryobacterium sp. Y82]|uniref:transposase n=1 Tax=Cryobacterium sp. Y82 TaxID=2045017 RepID=UPI0035166271